MHTFLRLIERFSALILLALLAITLFFAWQLPQLSEDSNPYLLDDSHPARRTILEMQEEFTGTYDAVLVAIHNEQGVFNRVTLDAVYDMTEAARRIILSNDADAAQLQALGERHGAALPEWAELISAILADGLTQNDYTLARRLPALAAQLPLSAAERSFIDFFPRRVNPIQELAGMAATENMVARDGVLVVRNAIPDRKADPELIRQEVMGNRMMVNGVVSADEKVALIAVELYIKQEDAEGQLRAYDAFEQIVRGYEQQHPEFTQQNRTYIAGVPIFIAEQKRLIDRDFATLLPVVLAVVTAILVLFFRRPLGVVLPLLNVVLATIWTLGLMALTRTPLDLITSALPVFLITICGADAIHMMNEFYTQRGLGLAGREAVKRMLRVMISPVLLTTITTVAAFSLSTITNISSIRSFGIFMACGIGFAQLIALFLVPAWLHLVGGAARASGSAATPTSARHQWLGQGLVWLFSGVIRHRRRHAIAFVLLMAAASVLTTRIHVEDAGSSYFAESNLFRQADEFINQHVAGTSPGWIEINTGRANGALTLEIARFVEQLDQFLAAQPHVTYSYSLAQYVQRMNLVMNDMDPAWDRLPKEVEQIKVVDGDTGAISYEAVSGDEIVAQSVLMYENGGGSDLTNVLNSDFSRTVLMFTMNSTRASEYQQLLDQLNGWLASNTPAGVEIKLGGSPVIWTGVLNEIIDGQLLSCIIGLAVVSLVLVVWLRSLPLGILASLPVPATLVSYFGLMTLLGIDLNIGTAIISFLVVGIVSDYAVHFLHRVEFGRRQGMLLEQALLSAVEHSGRSIFFNLLVFSLGFLTLLLSEFTPIQHLGALVAMALSISGFMALFLICLLAPLMLPDRVPTESVPLSNEA